MLDAENLSLSAEEIAALSRLIWTALDGNGWPDPVDRDNAARLAEKLDVLAAQMEPGAFMELA